jgi:hypothetical protein
MEISILSLVHVASIFNKLFLLQIATADLDAVLIEHPEILDVAVSA